MKFATCALVSVIVAGCAVTPDRIAQQSDEEICKSFWTYSQLPFAGATGTAYRQEIESADWSASRTGRWHVIAKSALAGMSLCALYASWGSPEHERRYVEAQGDWVKYAFNVALRQSGPLSRSAPQLMWACPFRPRRASRDTALPSGMPSRIETCLASRSLGRAHHNQS